MRHYTHLTPHEREKLFRGLNQGKSISQIAKELSRNKSTISREVRSKSVLGTPGVDGAKYSAFEAQKKYQQNRQHCRRKKKLLEPELREIVQKLFLDCNWSPEQIAARLKQEKPYLCISFVTIYRAIHAGLLNRTGDRRKPERYMRLRGKNGKKSINDRRGTFPIDHTLEERPQEAQRRERIGDIEADTVLGKAGGQCLVTLVDRRSRYLLCAKAASKTAAAVNSAMLSLLGDVPCLSLTPDRGKEFSRYREVSVALNGVPFYFPPPQSPWERGTNENTNGLLREYFPKGTDFSAISHKLIAVKVLLLNLRPRKCLDWRAPYEVFHSTSLHLT